MTFKEFIEKYDGKGINFDGAYGNQCMDLYRQYVQDVLEAPQSKSVIGAKDVWDTYRTDVFTRIDNTPDGVPQFGDVVIWGSGLGPYGHIAVFVDGDSERFRSFDQNWPEANGRGVAHLQEHDYRSVLGWLRPRKQPQEDEVTNDEAIRAIYRATQGPNHPSDGEMAWARAHVAEHGIDSLANIRFGDDVIGGYWEASEGTPTPDGEKKFWTRYQEEHPGAHPVDSIARTWFKDHVKVKLDAKDAEIQRTRQQRDDANAATDQARTELKNSQESLKVMEASRDLLAEEAKQLGKSLGDLNLEKISVEKQLIATHQKLKACEAQGVETLSAVELIIKGITKLFSKEEK